MPDGRLRRSVRGDCAGLRLALVVVSLLGGVVAPVALPARAQRERAVAALQSGVLVQLNQIRVAHGLVPLKLSAASLGGRATSIRPRCSVDGYFAHDSADGSAFWKRIERLLPRGRYRTWAVGENLLWNGGGLSATGALDLWMASPEHRANILSPRWREIGISALYDSDAPGAFGGGAVTLVATDFGART